MKKFKSLPAVKIEKLEKEKMYQKPGRKRADTKTKSVCHSDGTDDGDD